MGGEDWNSRFSTKNQGTEVVNSGKEIKQSFLEDVADSLSDTSTVVDRDLERGQSKSNNEEFWSPMSCNIEAPFPSGDAVRQELKSMVSNPELFQDGINVECLVIGPDEVNFAVKRYHTEWEWEHEAREIEKFGRFQHSATSPALASFKTGGKHYILFPWAKNGSLRDFWYENPDPTKLADDVELWLLQQCFGIAHALMEIHGDLLVPSHRVTSYVLHGDIKPENILFFPSEQTQTDAHESIVPEPDLGQLKLAYFGLSKFRESPTEENIGIPIAFCPTYRPPETEVLKGFINQSTDIWSLGCVFLEFATWYVMGATGLEAFINTWRNTNNMFPRWSGEVTKAAFFSVGTGLHGDKIMLNSSVTKLITDLREHPRSTKAVHAILDLIETKMLVHEDKRATAITITAALWNLLQNLSNNLATWNASMTGENYVPQDKEQLRLTLYDPFNPPTALDRWRVWLESLLGFNPVDWYPLPPVNRLQTATQSKLTWRYKNQELFIILNRDETERCLSTALLTATEKTSLSVTDSPENPSQSRNPVTSSNYPSSPPSQIANTSKPQRSRFLKKGKGGRKRQSPEPSKIVRSESPDPNPRKECYFCVDKATLTKQGTYFSAPLFTQELADDTAFFKLLKKRLKATSGKLLFGFMPWMAYNAVNLCQFSFMNDNSDLVAAFDLEEFPRDESVICAGYLFESGSDSVTAPLPLDIYMRKLGKTILAGLERPDDGWGRRNILNALPKRLVPPTLPRTYKTTGWGFHIRLGVNFLSVACWTVGLALLGLAFVPFWLVLIDKKDLQNAFIPASTLFSIAGMLLAWAALVQNKAWA